MFFITEEQKETVKVFTILFRFNIILIQIYQMTQYSMLNVKLSNSQLSKLKPAIKNGPEVNLNLSSNLIGNSNNETNFPCKLLLTDTQASKIREDFANGSSANTKFSKTQLSKIIQSGEILPFALNGNLEIHL